MRRLSYKQGVREEKGVKGQVKGMKEEQ